MVEMISTGAAYEDPADQDTYIHLGFVEEPKNSLVTKAQFTPSKIGGEPAWIAPAIPEERLICERCSTPFCFIAQVYANLDHLPDYHRMLYLFACVSPLCIKRSDCVRAYRAVIHDRNNHITFASDEDYSYVVDKTDASLKTSRYADMYDDDAQDSDCESAEGADHEATRGEFEEEEEKKEVIITTGNAPVTQ